MNAYTQKKVLVTGAGGFIGSHLTETLIDLGATVTGFIWDNAAETNNLSRDLPKEKTGKVSIHLGDLKEYGSLLGVMKGMDIVFHLAAINSVHHSLSHPREVIENNVNGTLNLLLAARESGVGKVIITSSAGVYGPPLDSPMDEKHDTRPASPYAASKLAAEEIALSFYHSFGLPVVILRLFNTFGPGQSLRAVIPNIILQALTGREVKLGRTDSIRDFNYVLNTVAGFTAAGIKENIEGEIFNIASGTEHSIEEVAAIVENLLNTRINIVIEDKRTRPGKSDADRLCASIEKAQEMLHYKPAISFHKGLKRTLEYYSEHLNDYPTGNNTI